MIFRVDVDISGETSKNQPISRLKTFRGESLDEVIERIRAWEQTEEFFKLTDESSCICHETVVGKNFCPYHGFHYSEPHQVIEQTPESEAYALEYWKKRNSLRKEAASRRFKLPPRT